VDYESFRSSDDKRHHLAFSLALETVHTLGVAGTARPPATRNLIRGPELMEVRSRTGIQDRAMKRVTKDIGIDTPS